MARARINLSLILRQDEGGLICDLSIVPGAVMPVGPTETPGAVTPLAETVELIITVLISVKMPSLVLLAIQLLLMSSAPLLLM